MKKLAQKSKPSPPKCQALNMNGRQCNQLPASQMRYFGDHEIYGDYDNPRPTWVRVYLCKKHRGMEIVRRKATAPQPRKESE